MGERMPLATDLTLASIPASESPGEWRAGRYALTLIAAGIPAGIAFAVAYLMGEPLLGTLLAGAPFALLILWKPELGLYLLAVAIPFELYGILGGTTVLKILGIFVFVAFLIHAIGGRRLELRPAAFLFALGFAVWSMMTMLASEFGEIARTVAIESTLTRIQSVGLVLVTLSLCATREQAKTLYVAMFLGAVGASILGFVTFAPTTVQEAASYYRMTLTGQDANAFAKDIMPGIFLAPFLWSQCRGWLRVGIVAGVLVVLAAEVATGSRSNYIALLAGVLLATAVYRRITLSRRMTIAVAILVGLVIVVVVGSALGLWSGGLWQRVEEIQRRGLGTGHREAMWQLAIQMGLDHPIMGVGVGNYFFGAMQTTMFHKTPHNDILLTFAETGFPGLILFLGFLVAVVRSALRVTHMGLRASLVGLVAAVIVAGMANPSHALKGYWLRMAAVVVGGLLFSEKTLSTQPAEPTVAGVGQLSTSPPGT